MKEGRSPFQQNAVGAVRSWYTSTHIPHLEAAFLENFCQARRTSAEPTYETQRIDHLGIVSGVCREIALIKQIDARVKDSRRKVSCGEGTHNVMMMDRAKSIKRNVIRTIALFSIVRNP